MAKLRSLLELLHHEVQVMYSAEKLITKGLPRMIEYATNEELKSAFKKHLAETERQAQHLEMVARLLDIDPTDDANPSLAGLLAEGEKVMGKTSTPEVLDAALIAGAQKIEHYEISGYGTAVELAHALGLTEVANVLQNILNEEKRTDEILTHLAKTVVNPRALAAN